MKYLFLLTIFLMIISGCVDKFEPPVSSTNTGNIAGDTLYIPVNPAWEGFNNPQAILIGNEPFIYVADTDNNRIVMLNIAGQVLGARSIQKPVALAQDYLLDLIVCAEFDSTIEGTTRTFSGVFKIKLFEANHVIENAEIVRVMPRPGISSDLKTGVKYTGVCAFFDNSFFVSRLGPNNSSFIDPDNSILAFENRKLPNGTRSDVLIGRLPSIEPLGTGLLTANNISSLTSFKRRNNDFIMTLTGSTSFKAQWLYFNFASESPGFENRLSPAFSDIMAVNKFLQPEGTCLDNSNNIFVADAGKDSIYKFNSFGDELQSFGGSDVFNRPHDVGFFDRTLYVVDTGNNRILRFILSTDLQ